MSQAVPDGGLSNSGYLTTVTMPKIYIIGIDITYLPYWLQFIVLSIGVFVFYIGYGYMQELIFQLDEMKTLGWYLTLFQFVLYTAYSFLVKKLSGEGCRKIPLKTYAQIAFYTVVTMGFSNASVGYLNYPTQVIFKCCKLVPVLIGGILIQGKRYNLMDFAAAALMSLGLGVFTLADSQVAPNFNPYGYVMISIALLADAVIGNVQEKAMKHYDATNTEMVLYSYSLGCFYVFLLTLFKGEFFVGFNFFLQHPLRTYGYIAVFSTLGFAGVNVVLSLLRTSGALLTVTVTTIRKTITIALSFIFFQKPFTSKYLLGGSLIFLAIYINVYNKNRSKFDNMLPKLLKTLIHRKKKLFKEEII